MKTAHQWRLEIIGAGDAWEERIKAIQQDALSGVVTAEDLLKTLTPLQRQQIESMLRNNRDDLQGSNDEFADYYSHLIQLTRF